ncbi:hypothetical protein FOCG_13257 [Fusarium oxysporum f. sp. radicis-lycopersici 26381]|nr:hypothetical protein FOZG_13838 [Fusarium oxysporum Fo47]EXL45906.1 hypothetical protein FOCG_13257 [Fusarium oxysporum f. sp. radicis-lycopersici 26381]
MLLEAHPLLAASVSSLRPSKVPLLVTTTLIRLAWTTPRRRSPIFTASTTTRLGVLLLIFTLPSTMKMGSLLTETCTTSTRSSSQTLLEASPRITTTLRLLRPFLRRICSKTSGTMMR